VDDVDYAARAFCTCGWAQNRWAHAHHMPSAPDDMHAADEHKRPTTALRFIGVWDADTLYDAVGFGRTWNGWATPVITREVLAQVIADAPGFRARFHAESGVAQIDTDQETGRWPRYAVIAPELRGGVQAYALQGLGWTFLQATDTRRAQEDAAWKAYAADRTGQLRLM